MYGKGTMIQKNPQRYYSSALHQVAKSSAVVPLKVPSQDNGTTTTMQQQQSDNDDNTTKQQCNDNTTKRYTKLCNEK